MSVPSRRQPGWLVRRLPINMQDDRVMRGLLNIIEQVAEYLRALKARGLGVLLVEQKLTIALEVADRCLVMGHGQIVFEGTPDDLRRDAAIRKEWLEV